MTKELLFKEEARNAMLRGIDKVANAISPTLGGKGRNVVINSDKPETPPHITKEIGRASCRERVYVLV